MIFSTLIGRLPPFPPPLQQTRCFVSGKELTALEHLAAVYLTLTTEQLEAATVSRDDAGRLALIVPGQDPPMAPTH